MLVAQASEDRQISPLQVFQSFFFNFVNLRHFHKGGHVSSLCNNSTLVKFTKAH